MAGIRVIAGSVKGRRLHLVPGTTTRPIGDRVKKALFDILGSDVQVARFLDLFAGTGSVGIEALSRGASHAVFVEKNRRAFETVVENLALTGLQDRAETILADAFAFLEGPPMQAFDYVYVAPPQYAGLWLEAVGKLDRRTLWLNPDAWVIAQIDPVEYTPPSLANLIEFDTRKYGRTMLVFYELPGG